MCGRDVREIVDALEAAGVPVWVDGGWGVDALLRRQTREHGDLDLALPLDATHAARRVLARLGFITYEDEMPTRLELRDPYDRRVDLHPLTFDADGNGRQQLQDGGFGTYTAAGLAGAGEIDGRPVRCLSASLQVAFHTGYAPDDDDRQDVRLLCAELGIDVPDEYRRGG
jgi:lincosamide nucleotidyltransferase A/C/D/E